MNHDDEPLFTDADRIHSYTRADALGDGVLIGLPEADTMGFSIPVAITDAAYEACIAWRHMSPRQGFILQIRTEGVLLAASMAVRAHRERALSGIEPFTDQVTFEVKTVARLESGQTERVVVPLRFVIGLGDELEPVGTIMLISED